MQDDFLIWLYDNFLSVFIFVISLLVLFVLLLVYAYRSRIKTRLYVIKQNTLESLDAKEETDGQRLISGQRIVVRRHEPLLLRERFTVYRCFFTREGTNETVSIRAYKKGDSTGNIEWSAIFESEAIRQSMKALLEEERKTMILMIASIVITALVIFVITQFAGG